MEYKINPIEIFDERVKIKNENKILHQLKEDDVIFDANEKTLPYYDHFETSSFKVSSIIQYGADINKYLFLKYHIVFPTFRKKTNDTRGSFAISFISPIDIFVNDELIMEKLNKVVIDENINIYSFSNQLKIQRTIINDYATTTNITKLTFTNTSLSPIALHLEIPESKIKITENVLNDEPYFVRLSLNNRFKKMSKNIAPHSSVTLYLSISCVYDDLPLLVCFEDSFSLRHDIFENCKYRYYIETNNPYIDVMSLKSKLKTTEAVFKNKTGYMHSPCGGQYYAAIWTNDQCEYSAPFFAYFDFIYANKAMENTFDLYTKYMYSNKAIVSSIVACGDDYWNGAGDRGDSEMYAYGLASYLLTKGNKELAIKYVKPLIYCLDYSLSKRNEEGVIFSDTDELENRFESGSYNLATNSIAYKALILGARLLNEVGYPNDYDKQAEKLKESIIKYFHRDNHYIYCNEEAHLRTHIVYPLLMGIDDYKEDIIKDITNPLLLNESGFKVIDNNETIWDRITLMAIRGMFLAEHSDEAYDILLKYSKNRLLGNHVPYAIEAYPEGNQAQLAAENALYARIFLEGILGFEPVSFSSFYLKVSLPEKLPSIKILNITYHDKLINIKVNKEKGKIHLIVEDLYDGFIENYCKVLIKIS